MPHIHHTNASVDAETAEPLKAFLTAGGSAGPQFTQTTAEPGIRITEFAWFKTEHAAERLLTPDDFKRKRAKMAGDRVACHRDAVMGNFDD